MVSPAVKQEAVDHLLASKGIKAERSCRLVGLETSTFHYRAKKKRLDKVIEQRLSELAQERVRWGCPRLFEMLRREGFKDNYKRVERIYRQAGLSLRVRPKKKLRSHLRLVLQTATRPNEIWSMDFVHDNISDGRRFRCFNLVDDFTRESLVMHVERSIRSGDLVNIFEQLKSSRGLPKTVRCDNGPELTAIDMDLWAFRNGVEIKTIQPGKPTQNAFVESFNGKFRAECLDQNWFNSIQEAKDKIEMWRKDYNQNRPHSSLNMKTPNEFAKEYGVVLTA